MFRFVVVDISFLRNAMLLLISYHLECRNVRMMTKERVRNCELDFHGEDQREASEI
jgi:hypothetical protein